MPAKARTQVCRRRIVTGTVLRTNPSRSLGPMIAIAVTMWLAVPAASGAEHEAVKLPAGPEGPGPFGAYYTRLRYADDWEAPWRVGEAADVVVRFDDGGHRFVFWRGTSYIPCWVTGNGIWYTNEFCETSGGGTKGCAEPMSDKQTRYAHVRVLESHDARAVVHWRYALTDVFYRIAYPDKDTDWGDWADEYYTVYPDGVAVRKIVLWTSRPDVWHEFQEAIVINPPGTAPEDNLETTAVTIANLAGKTADYVWDAPGKPTRTADVPDACIEIINLKAKRRPFVAIAPDEASISIFGGHAPNSRFNCWDHWPISQDKNWTRVATKHDRPTHTSLSWIAKPRESKPVGWKIRDPERHRYTKLLLTGLTARKPGEVVRLVRSWLSPPALEVKSPGLDGGAFDPAERAYRLRRKAAAKASGFDVVLKGSPERPIVNPALVIEDWDGKSEKVSVSVDGANAKSRVARFQKLNGTGLVVWLELTADRPITIRIHHD